MTVGGNDKKDVPQVPKCQKCLQSGHWTYECKGKRKIVIRESRTSMLNKRLKQAEEKQKIQNLSSVEEASKSNKKKNESSSDSSSDSDSSVDDSSDSFSSDSSSDSSDESD